MKLPSFNRYRRWVAPVLGVVVLLLIVAQLFSNSRTSLTPGGTKASSPGEISFSPTNLAPLDFSANGPFILAHQPDGTNLYRLNPDGTLAFTQQFDAPVLSARISPNGQQLVVETGTESHQSWHLMNTNGSGLRDLPSIVAADWLDANTLLTITDQQQLVAHQLNPDKTAPLGSQPDLKNAFGLTLEVRQGQVLVGATTSADDASFPNYWVITAQREIVPVPIPNLVQAHLSPTGSYVLASVIDDAGIRFFNPKDRTTSSFDPRLATTSLTGNVLNQDLLLTATPGVKRSWQVLQFTSNGPLTVRTLTAPVTWDATNFFLAGNTVYAIGSGHLYKNDLTSLLKSAK